MGLGLARVFLFIVTVVYGGLATAYVVPLHEQLTQVSLDLIDFCGEERSYASEAIVEFSGAEDYSPHEGSMVTRLTNWHFYTPRRSEDHQILAGAVNLDFFQRWEELLGMLAKESGEPIRSQIQGALVHFLQDVTNPSQVVPVYHGPGLSDSFDAYPPDVDRLRRAFPTFCKDLKKLSRWTDLLDQAAERSLRDLGQKFDFIENGQVRSGHFLGLFWKAPDKNDFFGSYGHLGNNFGKTEFSIFITRPRRGPGGMTREVVRNDNYVIDSSVYEEFAYRRHVDAIVVVAKALLLVK